MSKCFYSWISRAPPERWLHYHESSPWLTTGLSSVLPYNYIKKASTVDCSSQSLGIFSHMFLIASLPNSVTSRKKKPFSRHHGKPSSLLEPSDPTTPRGSVPPRALCRDPTEVGMKMETRLVFVDFVNADARPGFGLCTGTYICHEMGLFLYCRGLLACFCIRRRP